MDSLEKQNKLLKESLILMAIESWRMSKTLEKLLNSLDVKIQNRYQSKIRWFVKKTEDALNCVELKLVNYEGESYDPGIPVTPLNLGDFEANETLFIEQMIEPVIVDTLGNIVNSGVVSLGSTK